MRRSPGYTVQGHTGDLTFLRDLLSFRIRDPEVTRGGPGADIAPLVQNGIPGVGVAPEAATYLTGITVLRIPSTKSPRSTWRITLVPWHFSCHPAERDMP